MTVIHKTWGGGDYLLPGIVCDHLNEHPSALDDWSKVTCRRCLRILLVSTTRTLQWWEPVLDRGETYPMAEMKGQDVYDLATKTEGVLKRNRIALRGLGMKPPRRRVTCWVCCHQARRSSYWWSSTVGKRWVRTYGYCPATFGSGDMTWTCRGTLHRTADRRYVLQAAIAFDRDGGNHRSEFDGATQ